MGPRAGKRATESIPGSAGTPATPGQGRREEEGAIWVQRIQKDSDLSLKVQRWGPRAPFRTPLWPTGSWAESISAFSQV